jgi:hypothetical protein
MLALMDVSHCIASHTTYRILLPFTRTSLSEQRPQDRRLDMGDCFGTAHTGMCESDLADAEFFQIGALGSDWAFATIYTARTGPP